MGEKVLYAELAKMRGKEQRDAAKKGPAPALQVVAPQTAEVPLEESTKDSLHFEQERAFIRLLVNHGNQLYEPFGSAEANAENEILTIAQYMIAQIYPDELTFLNPRFQYVYETVLEALKANRLAPDDAWFTRQEDPDFATLTADLLENNALSPNWEEKGIHVKRPEGRISEHADQVVLRFKDAKLKKSIAEIQDALKTAVDDEERLKLLATFAKLNTIRQQISAKLNRVV
jgi:hypothetical protein